MTEDRLLRVPEVARLLGVCTRIVWELLSKGVLPRVKHPGFRNTCVRMSDVVRYQQSLGGS